MRFSGSIFRQILKPISPRGFEGIVSRHDGDAYDKSFKSWDHLAVLIYAQLSKAQGLRGLETVWNANSHHHYHLGVGKVARATLSDANARRPTAVFSETFAMVSGLADRILRREGQEMLRLIDSTPIPVGRAVQWAKWNGRIRGLKLHLVYDPVADNPTDVAITDANVNDVEVGERLVIAKGCTYVFDKAYCKYPWWTAVHDTGAFFVTRQKISTRLRAARWRKPAKRKGDGFTVIDDAEVRFVSKGDSKLAIPMRRIRVRREDGAKIAIVTNDMTRSAHDIAALYKKRWQIELFFRWIKQHLVIKTLLGRSANAIKLQLLAAMIAYVLMRLAIRENLIKISVIRFADLLAVRLFMRRPIAKIDKPPDVHPSRPKPHHVSGQMEFAYV